MVDLKQIEALLEDQSHIIIDLNISVKNIIRLNIDRFDHEAEIKKHGFFRHHWYQLKFISVIQLAKLFSSKPNEKRSFKKLCSIIEAHHYGADEVILSDDNVSNPAAEAKSKVDVLKIVDDTKKVLEVNEFLIKKIVDARDKLYAHKDPNPQVGYIEIDEIEPLVKTANDLHNNFSFKFLNQTTMFSEVEDWDVDYVLWYMSETRKRDMDEKEQKKKTLNKTNF